MDSEHEASRAVGFSPLTWWVWKPRQKTCHRRDGSLQPEWTWTSELPSASFWTSHALQGLFLTLTSLSLHCVDTLLSLNEPLTNCPFWGILLVVTDLSLSRSLAARSLGQLKVLLLWSPSSPLCHFFSALSPKRVTPLPLPSHDCQALYKHDNGFPS